MFENLFQWFLVIIFILWLLSIVRFLFCDPFRWYRNTDGESMPIEGEVITLVRVNINGFRYDALQASISPKGITFLPGRIRVFAKPVFILGIN